MGKRDQLLGPPSSSKPSGHKIPRGKRIVIFLFLIALALGSGAAYLTRNSFIEDSPQSKFSDHSGVTASSDIERSEVARLSEDPPGASGITNLTGAEREYRNMVEDEELARLLNKQASKRGGTAVDLSRASATARSKGEQAVKELRLRKAGNQSDKIDADGVE